MLHEKLLYSEHYNTTICKEKMYYVKICFDFLTKVIFEFNLYISPLEINLFRGRSDCV